MNAQRYARLSLFREAYSRLLVSTRTTEALVRRTRELLAGEYADVAEDAKLWLLMDHGLNVDTWDKRKRTREGEE